MNANEMSQLKYERFKMDKGLEKKEPFEHEDYRERKFEHVKKHLKFTKTPFINFAAGQEPITAY